MSPEYLAIFKIASKYKRHVEVS